MYLQSYLQLAECLKWTIEISVTEKYRNYIMYTKKWQWSFFHIREIRVWGC